MAVDRQEASVVPRPTDDLKEVVATARALVLQENARAERLDAKTRGQVQLAGQWFAIAQAVLAVAVNNDSVDRTLLWLAAASAALAAVALAVTLFFSWKVWRLRDETEISPQGILDLLDSANADKEDTLDLLARTLSRRLYEKRQANAERARELANAEGAWLAAMGLPLVELVLALGAVLI